MFNVVFEIEPTLKLDVERFGWCREKRFKIINRHGSVLPVFCVGSFADR